MNFAEYLSQVGDGTGGPSPQRPCPPDMVCFEDGTMMTADEFRTSVITPNVGTQHYPTGVRHPSDPHQTYADGTGGDFVFGRSRRVAPTHGDGTGGPYGPTSTPVAASFARLIEELRRKRGR